jgi:hypothetical protein
MEIIVQPDFMFQLTPEEFDSLRSHFATFYVAFL